MVYLLAGPNKHLKSRWVSKIRTSKPDYEFITFDSEEADKTNISSIDSVLSQVSLFDATKKILYIKEWSKGDLTDFLMQKINIYKDDSDIILLLDSNDAIRSNAKVRKMVNEKSIITAEDYTLLDLDKIVTSLLKEGNVKDAESIKSLILEKVDKNPYLIENETNKIVLASLLEPIGKDEASEYIIPSVQYSIWEYIKFATTGKIGSAMQVLSNLLENGENEYAILGLLLWNIKLMAVILASGSKADQVIAKDFSYNPYSIKNARSIVRRYSLKKLIVIYNKMTELEEKMKTGKIEPKMGLLLLTMVF